MIKRLAMFLIFALVCVAAATADYTIVQETTVRGDTYTSETIITDEMVRTNSAESDTIVNSNTGQMTFINHREKNYWVTTLDELQEKLGAADEGGAVSSILQGIMGGDAEVEITKLDETRTIANYETQRYLVTMGKNFRFDLWVAPKLKVPATYYDGRKLPGAMAGPMGKQLEKLYEGMKEIGALSLASDSEMKMMGMTVETTTIATEVKTDPVPPTAFDPPAGYTLTDAPF
ncbi:MAG: hypothetical protein AAGD38_13425 [Acidobacteriota bacterium]